jgi:serine/threonine-protein kinase
VDIYSLGAVLYFLLTRRAPFVADSALDALLLVVEGEAVLPRSINPAVPVELERICLRCLEKAPENRYASAGELAADLERFLKGEPLARVPRELPHRLYAWARRQPALVSRLLAMAICTSISVTAYQIYHPGSPRRHLAVLTVLSLWAWISVLCQKALTTGLWAGAARFAWAGADVACLTAILLIDQALESPLTALYPALVATSGLWLRVPLVAFTTGTVVLGYTILVLHTYHRHAAHVPPHWHLVVLVVLVLSGLSVAYLVHRVRALTRFYERGPEP